MRRLLQRLKALRNDAYILYLAFRHPGTPSLAKVVVGLIVAYVFSPIDLVPDFIPFLGYVDELILVPIFLSVAYRLVPRFILEECSRIAQKNPLTKKLRLWSGAFIVLMVWIILAFYVVHWYYRS